ncbi:MAG TPA: hypothetical protein VFA15_04850, partial [Nitrososphaera sp.]|nr:hypothetical protein [Nitrososphaera sp.]
LQQLWCDLMRPPWASSLARITTRNIPQPINIAILQILILFIIVIVSPGSRVSLDLTTINTFAGMESIHRSFTPSP